MLPCVCKKEQQKCGVFYPPLFFLLLKMSGIGLFWGPPTMQAFEAQHMLDALLIYIGGWKGAGGEGGSNHISIINTKLDFPLFTDRLVPRAPVRPSPTATHLFCSHSESLGKCWSQLLGEKSYIYIHHTLVKQHCVT